MRNMSKYDNYDAHRYAAMFKALSNPHRLNVFMRLASSCCLEGQSCSGDDQICECVGVLGKDLGISPSTVSHHLKELQRSGLIKMKRHGQRTECWVDPEVLDALTAFFQMKVSA
jgi:DNA-binding transcriptional ArsR family regulator